MSLGSNGEGRAAIKALNGKEVRILELLCLSAQYADRMTSVRVSCALVSLLLLLLLCMPRKGRDRESDLQSEMQQRE